MARNEFGVESSDSGGFGAGVGDDFESMFEEATNASVADDEISETGTKKSRKPEVSFETQNTRSFEDEAPQAQVEEEPTFNNSGPSFGVTDDVEELFRQAENASVEDEETEDSLYKDNEVASNNETEVDHNQSENFEDFGSSIDDLTDSWPDNNSSTYEEVEPEQREVFFEPEPVIEPEPEPVIEEVVQHHAPRRNISNPVPSISVPEIKTEPISTTDNMEEAVDYIERVILTSDAIRELSEDDGKAVNMFITAGQPVESHQELVLTALQADRQIHKTADAILEAKSKTSVDRAFYILGLDDKTFEDFGKILSHDLESTESAIFEGDRLRYARKLVDVVEALPEISIKRFEAVKSVLGAGELEA